MEKTLKSNVFLKMHAIHRMIVSLLISLLALVMFALHYKNLYLRLVVCWDVFAFVYCFTSWIVFFSRHEVLIKKEATVEDGSRVYVFLVLLIACFASLLTVLLLMLSHPGAGESGILYNLAAVFGMLLSWTMVHTTFCFHYANLYYKNAAIEHGKNSEGLIFPGERNPDYLDFAYFSFVIGMTFQVSDVEISNRIIRRTVLLHGLISFLLNTFVVALTINIIAGLRNM